MVARTFQVVHDDTDFDINYDTDDGFEVRLFLCNLSFSNSISLSKSISFLRYSTVAGFSVSTLFPHFRSTSSAKGSDSPS